MTIEQRTRLIQLRQRAEQLAHDIGEANRDPRNAESAPFLSAAAHAVQAGYETLVIASKIGEES